MITNPLFRSSFCLLALITTQSQGAIVFATAQSGPNTPSTITDELAFAGDISTTDLLHNNVGSGGSWSTGTDASPNSLTDGLNGGDFDASGISAPAGAAWAMDGVVSTRTYIIGPNPLGYDIDRIQSIAGWQGAGFQNQKYNIFISTVTVPAYTLLTTVNYQPAAWVSTDVANAKGGATKVVVYNDAGPLATGVVGIRFDILDTVSPDGGGVVMREIDVFAVPEPSAAVLLGLGSLAFLRRRRV